MNKLKRISKLILYTWILFMVVFLIASWVYHR